MPPRLPKVPHPFPSLSLTHAFTPNSLENLRAILDAQLSNSYLILPSTHTNDTRDAAVLIPFCNVAGKPGILLEVRAWTLRSHCRNSFPGGKRDKGDPSLCDTALRETMEELGIQPNRVEILGQHNINPACNRDLILLQGFVHASGQNYMHPPDQPYPSIDIDLIRKAASPAEVDTVFHLPLTALTTASRMRSDLFRGERQYWAINATDLIGSGVNPNTVPTVEESTQEDEVGAGRGGRVEVWGLTGWYLSLLMRTLHVYQ